MRRSYFSDASSRWIAIADSLVVVCSMAVALVIRAQFKAYYVQPLDILIMMPWLLVLRIVTNVIFEHYTLNVSNFSPHDFTSLFVHNVIPSGIMIVLRLGSPVSALQMPLSVIGMEYIFTCFGFMVDRLVALQFLVNRTQADIRHREHVLLWGEVREIVDKRLIARVEAAGPVRVVGILSSNALYWDTEVRGIRVFGDETQIPTLVGLDESISVLCIANSETESRAVLSAILEMGESVEIKIGIISPDGSIEKGDNRLILPGPDGAYRIETPRA